MRKTGLKVGILLMILGAIISVISFSLLFLTNNRVRFGESVFGLIPAGILFLLGFIFTILSVIFTVRAKKIAAIYRTKLQAEGIIFFEEDVSGSMTFRNFRSPGSYASWRKAAIAALVVLTQKRILALKGSSAIIDVPFADERLKQIKFSLENENILLAAFDANLFQPEWSGEIEYRFKTKKAREFLQKINETQNKI